MKLKIIK